VHRGALFTFTRRRKCFTAILLFISSMPTEVCWGCKQLKPGVKLCAEDRLCRECDAANQRALSAARIETEKNSKQSKSVKNAAKNTGSSSLSSIHSQPVYSSPQSNVVINGAFFLIIGDKLKVN